MIKSFKDALTEAAFNGEVRKGFPADLIKVPGASSVISTPRSFLRI
jgi:hypothetical protein